MTYPNTADQTTETSPASTETDETPDPGTSGSPESQSGSQGDSPARKEARYRVERNQAREERDQLTARLESLQTREAERIASKNLANPADLLSLGDVTVRDLLDEHGEIDPEKVDAVATEILGKRPGLGLYAPATDPSQGQSGGNGKPQPSWSALLAD